MPALPRVTYANVAATLALAVALGGTSYAATKLPAGSVGTQQLRANAVTSPKIRNGTVGTADLSPAARSLAASGPAARVALGGTVAGLPSASPGNTALTRGSVVGASESAGFSSNVAMLNPVATRLSALTVRLHNPVPAGGQVRFEVVAETSLDDTGAPGVLSCAVLSTESTCTSTASAPVAAGAVLYVRISVDGATGGPTTPGSVSFGYVSQPG